MQKLLTEHTIFQAYFGSESVKPTNFATGGMSRFKETLKQFHRKVDWKHLTVLQGRNDDGTWATAQAKEYPSDLNRALAWSFLTEYRRRSTETKPVAILEPFHAEFLELWAGDVDMHHQALQPDYHLRVRNLEVLD